MLRGLVDALDDGVVLTDDDGVLVLADPAGRGHVRLRAR